MTKVRLAAAGVALAVSAVLLSGCGGGGGFATAKVRGKVTFKGQPVANARVDFSPQKAADAGKGSGGGQPGKSAAGTTDKDGVFVLSTYAPEDGAVVGKHRVAVGSNDAKKPLPGKTPPNLILEVKSGSNDFTIELVP
jgi:hypothetical protein